MELKKISPKVTVSPQIAAMDTAAIKAAGYRAIICSRPDGEGADQPSFEEIEAAASRAAWFIKEKMLPPICWQAMLRGREWMAKPERFRTAAE